MARSEHGVAGDVTSSASPASEPAREPPALVKFRRLTDGRRVYVYERPHGRGVVVRTSDGRVHVFGDRFRADEHIELLERGIGRAKK